MLPDWDKANRDRGQVRRATVDDIDDSGATQTAKVTAHEGDTYEGVEVLQPAGFASRPAGAGTGILVAVGGDHGDVVLLPASDPSSRLFGLKKGESALYNTKTGERVLMREDGTAEVTARKFHATTEAAEIEADGQMIRCRLGDGAAAPRLTAKQDYVKLRIGSVWIALTSAGIVSSHPVVIGPDPDPEG
jgi:phage gp45-like